MKDHNRRNDVSRMTITEQFLKIQEEMCDKYCRYPELTKELTENKDEAFELLTHMYCENCPLGRL